MGLYHHFPPGGVVMSKLSAVIVGLVGCAAGLFLGLAVASLTASRPPAVNDAPPAVNDAPPAVDPATPAATQPPSPIANDWGPLAELPEAFGPGTAAFRLIEHLGRHGSWVPNEKTGGPPLTTFARIGVSGETRTGRAYLELTQIDAGKLCIEAVVSPYQWPDPRLEVVMQYALDGVATDLALAHRGRVFGLLAEGLQMPPESREAAQRIERAVPMWWTAKQRTDAMAQFCRHLPPEAVKRLGDCLRNYAEMGVGSSATPRVGFLLSDRWMMEVIFARAVTGHFQSGDIGVNSQHWSLLLGGPECGESGVNKSSWPRLTEAETADFLAALAPE